MNKFAIWTNLLARQGKRICHCHATFNQITKYEWKLKIKVELDNNSKHILKMVVW